MRTKSFTIMRILCLMLLAVSFLSVTALAEHAGWNKTKQKIFYYNAVTAEDGTETATLEKAVGLLEIEGRFYFFNENGELQTGFVETEEGYRYFNPKGDLGSIGSMIVGLKKIGKYRYYFDEKGLMATGYTVTPKGTYYFRKTGSAGVKGRAYVNKWRKADGARRYFGKYGKMLVSQWVGKYYVDENGARVTNTVTPDGYLVDKNGEKVSNKKVKGLVEIDDKVLYFSRSAKDFLRSKFKTVSGKRYYFGSDGVALTGLQTINGSTYYFGEDGAMCKGVVKIKNKEYYFSSNGKLLINGTEDGYTTDENGVLTESAPKRILLVAGHGQGDGGAASALGTEYLKTREFAKLVYEALSKSDKVRVDFYKDGSTSYDLYQQNKATLGSAGANMSDAITGKGSVKNKVITEMAKNKNLPVLTDYDYVLEVHFNATAESNKDIGGNGSYKGFSFYVNSYKKNYTVENKMITKIKSLGFAIFGYGVHASSTLFNARICQELGVDYSLVETAFIDDKDDMTFYNANKTKMAKAVADSIIEYYG